MFPVHFFLVLAKYLLIAGSSTVWAGIPNIGILNLCSSVSHPSLHSSNGYELRPLENQTFACLDRLIFQNNFSLHIKQSRLSKRLVFQWYGSLENINSIWWPLTPLENRTDPYHSNSECVGILAPTKIQTVLDTNPRPSQQFYILPIHLIKWGS